MSKIFEDKRILVTGGTGSLGQALIKRLLSGKNGLPESVTVFSRDEAKQHYMRLDFAQQSKATDEIIFENSKNRLRFRIGDVRDYHSLADALRNSDIVFSAAALKQVPSCEYAPWEAVRTNIEGAENLVRAVSELRLPIETVVGISTDKACKPVNVMGMTKAIQERVYIQGNLRAENTRFIAARYGNVLASRGSVVPLFIDQIERGGPVTITAAEMTRFLLTLDDAVDTIFSAVEAALPGETYIPRCSSARMVDLADVLIDGRDIGVEFSGIRPGEKVHESLLSAEESARTVMGADSCYALRSMLPELSAPVTKPALEGEFSSDTTLMSRDELANFLKQHIPEAIGQRYLGS